MSCVFFFFRKVVISFSAWCGKGCCFFAFWVDFLVLGDFCVYIPTGRCV